VEIRLSHQFVKSVANIARHVLTSPFRLRPAVASLLRETSRDTANTNSPRSKEENVMKSRVVNIRIPSEIERTVEAESAERSLTISELVCEALLARYDRNANARVEQLLYEAVRTRLTLQHYIDHTQSSELTDGIREAATREAQQYLARLRNRT
jgi:hypothetical protein